MSERGNLRESGGRGRGGFWKSIKGSGQPKPSQRTKAFNEGQKPAMNLDIPTPLQFQTMNQPKSNPNKFIKPLLFPMLVYFRQNLK